MEYTDFLEKAKNHLNDKLPMVIYRKPNEKSIHGFLQQTNHLRVSSNFNSSGFVFSPFKEGKDKTVWLYEDECTQIETIFRAEELSKSLIINKKQSSVDKQKHIDIVSKSIDLLKSGSLQKVVISRSELVYLKEIDPLSIFKNILNTYINTFCYCWYHPKVGLWLGASPETLISLENNNFDTMALAGTLPYKGFKNVIWGAKEKEEQQLVVDSIIKGLKVVTKTVKKDITTTQKAGALLHLKTNISGELNTFNDLKNIIDVLHPTSAVCGLPKEKSKAFILANETYNRSYYTGYLGDFSPKGKTHLFVNLRCMQINKNTAQIYIGGGITALSNSEAEWEETVNKSQTMKAVL